MKHRYYFIFILVLLAEVATAQVQSPRNRFRVDYTRGCIPLSIAITDLTTADQVSYYLNYIGKDSIADLGSDATQALITEADSVYLVQLAEGLSPVKDSLLILSYTAVPPSFSIFACSNYGAVVNVTDRTYNSYEVSFGTAAPVVASAANNYTVEGTFAAAGPQNVRVLGRYTNDPGNCAATTKTVEARASLAQPLVTGLQWNPLTDSVRLQYQLAPEVKYQLERLTTSGSFERVLYLPGSSTDTAFVQPGLQEQPYCYRITALNECDLSASVASEAVCTASWRVRSVDGINYVEYQTGSNFSGEVQLYSQDNELIATATTPAGEFTEEEVICGATYCYKLQLVPASPGAPTAESAPLCVVARRSAPLPPLKNIVSYWQEQQLVVLPELPAENAGITLTLSRPEGQRLVSARGDSLLYNAAPVAACYALSYKDPCGNEAINTSPLCPLFLSNRSTEPDVFEPFWNAYVGYQQGVQEYVLQELDPYGVVIEEWPAGASTTLAPFTSLTPEDTGRRFRVKAIPAEAGLSPSFSNIFTFELIMKGYFPNAFSPNGDGVNDEFKILGKFVESATLWVFDRWGGLLFTTNNKEEGWNGTINGKPVAPGVYAYKAAITTADGHTCIVTGTVFLNR